MTRFWTAVFLGLALLWSVGSAQADQKDPRLDPLFEALYAVPVGSPEASFTQQQIWMVWLQAPSATGRILMQQGMDQMRDSDFLSAIKTFTALIQLEPDYAEAWNKRATVHFLIGNYADSLADIDETLALEPRHFGAQSGQGLIFDSLEDISEAIQAFEKTLKLNPHMAQIRSRLEQLRAAKEGQEI